MCKVSSCGLTFRRRPDMTHDALLDATARQAFAVHDLHGDVLGGLASEGSYEHGVRIRIFSENPNNVLTEHYTPDLRIKS